ncbi:MAG: aminomethyl-transferring glycine dehydrogenase subunit GcvPA [Burkholderiales bacterium]|nr:aminomethyl-transferring glycine dehydrogenase subunit GcvPA [Burkholderiales bacterium]
MNYLPHTESERRAMLDTLGVSRMEELFADIPEHVRFPDLKLPLPPLPLSQMELEAHLRELAGQDVNATSHECFLGAGAYHHYIPATVDYVTGRGEFFTAYTPYQPEASQGMLQAMFEYQSMICQLTGMDVTNASHYDGATALAEAVRMALNLASDGRQKVILSPTVNPHYRETVQTYLLGSEASLIGEGVVPGEMGSLVALLDDRVAALVIQNPNFLGQFEDVAGLADQVHQAGALLIVVTDPIALGLFQPPGAYGADVVVADGQPLGIPLSFGGPYLGIFATRMQYVRQMPGRLVGETVDRSGRRGYVLTLAAREQHIRRARATSNICTNAGLMALAAATYLATLGKSGLRRVAELCYHKSHYAAQQLAERAGLAINPHKPDQPFFKEFSVQLPRPVEEVNRILLEDFGIIGGFDLGSCYFGFEQQMLIAVTEMKTKAAINRLVDALAKVTA